MNKTHVSDSPPTGRQYHNRQIALRFCAGRGVGRSVRSSVQNECRMSVGSSAGTRNVVRFFPVTPEKRELALGNHKT
jgi:hypothetical protein